MNVGMILIAAMVVGFVFSIFLTGVGLAMIAGLALVGGIIIWFGAMLEMALFLRRDK